MQYFHYELKQKQDNRGDMRKIHVTRLILEASSRHGDFFKTQKTCFQIRSMGVYLPNFRSVSFFVWPGGVTQINKQIHIYSSEFRIILDRLFASRGF